MKFARRLFAFLVNAALLMCNVDAARATIIVLVRNQDEVGLAADSKVIFRGDNKPSTEGSICKIHQVGSIYFGIAGAVKIPNSEYDPAAIIAGELRNNSHLADAAKSAGELVKTKLLTALPQIERFDPLGYDKIRTGSQAVSFALATMDGGIPTAIQIIVDLSRSDALVRQATSKSGLRKVMAIGSPEAIRRVKSVPTTKTAADLALALVQFEIDSGNPEVGPPIDAVSVRADGATWIRQKPGCPVVE
jgi:hypothetical protein